ncbi:vacuolar protein sorting-associated protein 41 [Calocera viscosa TUFC12733]|uniref:Vacuolar protein sorting-associated protein 41 n=1 Tax=Calocera viscosa (strain TUFC12733) TaxID=1330018 RepID=A0A167QV01_CALVF|nr:vacuolar protein sorting-associated protein 41 [Calocera viscosa TUFC12733]
MAHSPSEHIGEEHVEEDGDAEEDEEEGDEDEDGDEEDEEPTLKYETMKTPAFDFLQKEAISSVYSSTEFMTFGTHNGVVHVIDHQGNNIKAYRSHSATISSIDVDYENQFIATASVDGKVIIHSLHTPENYSFDLRRPMRTVALEPGFAHKSGRQFVCGGMAGNLLLYDKGWMGHKAQILHSGEGPIWETSWMGNLIAWANDLGVKIFDTASHSRIGFIDRAADSPRADLFKCNLRWRDEHTLLIGWAGHLKVARVRQRPNPPPGAPPLMIEITSHFALDYMVAGIASYQSSYLMLSFIPPDTYAEEETEDRERQRRKSALPPELNLISRSGEQESSDVLAVAGYGAYGCNDYALAPSIRENDPFFIVMSPKSVIVARPRDASDHVDWLVEKRRYAEALEEVEKMGGSREWDAISVGEKFIESLVEEGQFEKAAHLCPKVCRDNSKAWEDWIFIFVQKGQLPAIIPVIPTQDPQLSHVVYEMVLAHYLSTNRDALLHTIRTWPHGIYDSSAVIAAVQGELERQQNSPILMECLAELFIQNHQPGRALPYLLRLRKPNVIDLIREHNLFTAVRDQVLLLVEFDQDLEQQRRENEGETSTGSIVPRRSAAIALLVEHTDSIPIGRVVQQLEARALFLYLYLDALFDRDPLLTSDFADRQVQLYAEFDYKRLMDFLRASNYYSLERAYRICKQRDFVPEQVFLLGRMGNNKAALNLIIERLGDVKRAIDFAKEQNDEELWEDLLRYSETRPAFIRGLLENVGAEINPVRLIRRIRNGLEVPGLKTALIKILQDFNLQISLLQGTQAILFSDCTDLARRLQSGQTSGAFCSATMPCPACDLPLFVAPTASADPEELALSFLCGHIVHARHVKGGTNLPVQQPNVVRGFLGSQARTRDRLGAKLAYASSVRARLAEGCPVCHRSDEGEEENV